MLWALLFSISIFFSFMALLFYLFILIFIFFISWGIPVYPWLIHVNVWQKPLQSCKVISLHLNFIPKQALRDGGEQLQAYVIGDLFSP